MHPMPLTYPSHYCIPIHPTVCIEALYSMENELVFQTALVSLALITLLAGLYTQSLKKMAGTYFFGMVAICGVLLPDWKFFSRPVSHWCTVVEARPAPRFKLHPVRVVIYGLVYGFGFYHWLKFIKSE